MATRVMGNKEGNSKGGNSDGNGNRVGKGATMRAIDGNRNDMCNGDGNKAGR